MVDQDFQKRHARTLRHKRAVLALAKGPLTKRFEYTWDVPDDLPDQFLMLSNHQSDFDPALVFVTFPDRFFYFFAGEQVLCKRMLGRLVRFIADPIPIMRQTPDVHAVRKAFAIIRAGGSFCFYPSGEREWDGFAMPIADSIGKFVKMTKVPLVTFNIEGMYFVNPRWGARMRHLPTHGHVVGVYDTATLSSMTAQEVAELVRRDLSVDSTAWRASVTQPTRGRNLAEYLEAVLYLCPGCNKVNTLHSHGDLVSCGCGFSARYTDHDVFDDCSPFHTVHEWCIWQRAALCEQIDSEGDAFDLEVDDAQVFKVEPAAGHTLVASGTLALSHKGISCGDWGYSLPGIAGLARVASNRIMLTTGEGHFEIIHKRPWNTSCFTDSYSQLKAGTEQTA